MWKRGSSLPPKGSLFFAVAERIDVYAFEYYMTFGHYGVNCDNLGQAIFQEKFHSFALGTNHIQ